MTCGKVAKVKCSRRRFHNLLLPEQGMGNPWAQTSLVKPYKYGVPRGFSNPHLAQLSLWARLYRFLLPFPISLWPWNHCSLGSLSTSSRALVISLSLSLSLSLNGSPCKFDWCEPFDLYGSHPFHPGDVQWMRISQIKWHVNDCCPCLDCIFHVSLVGLTDDLHL